MRTHHTAQPASRRGCWRRTGWGRRRVRGLGCGWSRGISMLACVCMCARAPSHHTHPRTGGHRAAPLVRRRLRRVVGTIGGARGLEQCTPMQLAQLVRAANRRPDTVIGTHLCAARPRRSKERRGMGMHASATRAPCDPKQAPNERRTRVLRVPARAAAWCAALAAV